MSTKNKRSRVRRFGISGLLVAGLAFGVLDLGGGFIPLPNAAQAAAGGLSSAWVDGHASRVRMIAGRSNDTSGRRPQGIVAGVEISLQPGWKTYWRIPGEAGGVPPHFDWSRSKNVADAKVIFPAPKRLADASGDSIGYKDGVVFPVIVTPADASKPVELSLDFSFGVCSDICIPAEASLSLGVPQGVSVGVPPGIEQALDHAPRVETNKRVGDPEVAAHDIVLTGKTPRVVLDIDFGSKPKKGDLFAEAPAGLYLPMAKRAPEGDAIVGVARFVIDLAQTLDLDDLKGETITLTLVGEDGQSERKLRLE